VPFWDSLSFVFLSYFSWIAAASWFDARHPSRALMRRRTAVLGGFLMMLLDVIIDPLTLLGDRWFLGRIYYYPDGGSYFGVTLANFAGWWFVGSLTLWITQRLALKGGMASARWAKLSRRDGWGVWGVYGGIMAFNLAITAWIGEGWLLAASFAVATLTLGPSLLHYREGALP
jgi:putative membrane protein